MIKWSEVVCIGDLSIETPNKYLLDNFNFEGRATKRVLFGTYFDVVYHSGTWTENKEIYIASTVFRRIDTSKQTGFYG